MTKVTTTQKGVREHPFHKKPPVTSGGFDTSSPFRPFSPKPFLSLGNKISPQVNHILDLISALL